MKHKLFGNKKESTEDVVVTDDSVEIVSADEDSEDSMDEMQKVARTISEIKKQNPIQALLSGSKNERALAENDALISSVIKNILNWLAVITSAETVRKEEYDALTSQMLQLDEDVNEQLEMQVKFKKAYQIMMQKQEEQKVLTEKVEKLQKENLLFKIVSCVALGIGCIALVIALI
jgi:predicted transport protein